MCRYTHFSKKRTFKCTFYQENNLLKNLKNFSWQIAHLKVPFFAHVLMISYWFSCFFFVTPNLFRDLIKEMLKQVQHDVRWLSNRINLKVPLNCYIIATKNVHFEMDVFLFSPKPWERRIMRWLVWFLWAWTILAYVDGTWIGQAQKIALGAHYTSFRARCSNNARFSFTFSCALFKSFS